MQIEGQKGLAVSPDNTSDKFRDDEFRDHVDRAYATRAALVEAWPAEPSGTTFTTLARRLLGRDFVLTLDDWRQIKGDPTLRASWDYLRRARTLVELPRVAAASLGGLTTRNFDNGSVTIIPSTKVGTVYVKIAWRPLPQAPRFLLLEREDAESATRTLPLLRASGDFLLVCDGGVAADQLFLRLLSDPRTSGAFLV